MKLELKTADREYTKHDVETVRKQIIKLRDAALKQNDFHWPIVLSHNIAILSCLLEHME